MKAYRRHKDSGRQDLVVPDRRAITEYFYRLAPEELVIPDPPETSRGSLSFTTERIEFPADQVSEAVSYLAASRTSSMERAAGSNLFLCDVGSGWLHQLSWDKGKSTHIPLGKAKNPCHITGCDYDRDGNEDFVVADLGVYNPSDALKGSVVLLRSIGDSQSYELIKLAEGLGRVADVQPADLDGDGDVDFVVAEFGFEKAGRLIWLETTSIVAGVPKTLLHVIDKRHGSIHCPVADLDQDGDLDLVVLFSQEYESIDAFINDGQGHFEKRTLFSADNASFGSSGLELSDLDSDGDLDVLFTNGDTLDTFLLRPFHAVNWLENHGGFKFEHHHLTILPGALRALAGDFDGDGDVDIAAVAFCPRELHNQTRPQSLDTLIWLEQVSPRQFERHTIEKSAMGHVALAVGDFDGDQDIDFAVGEFPSPGAREQQWLSIYWNQLKNEARTNRE